MGIKYFWKYLTSLNVVKEKLGSVDSKQFFGVAGNAAPKGVPGGPKGVDGEGCKGRVYVDILGCLYTEIIRCVELGHPSRPCNFAPLIQKLKRIFPDGGTVFVIDGAPTSAKSETSMKRVEKDSVLIIVNHQWIHRSKHHYTATKRHREWGKVVDELDKVAASMKQAADDGRKRMPKSFYGYIGRVANDLDIVVSGDSDLLCYKNVRTMVRRTRHRGQYVLNVLDKSLALRKMKLNADDLVILAVVSGNDYVSNIPGKAIVTNVKIFQKIKENGDFSKEAMLKEGEYLFKAHWTPNPFMPLQSVGEVGCYTYSTIDKTAPMKCPVPPVLKVSPKAVEFDHDEDEEVKEVPEEKAVQPSSKAKAKRTPSGRNGRTKTVEKNDSDEESSKKNFFNATGAIASLSKRCGGYRTIHVGHLRGHICIDQKEVINHQ
ncbi:hypothetical protein SeLEV6574_g07321 [Synchytrium endobioticum]|uniref:Uncharacterized protein n=1 Tax=Synchytrium endobioticum TaxID=286115 RepID=A0A507CLW9_9FUNG|nr:hypothetical protein SeLEV6574_g07321 [Synchytrium endobioticum]